MRGSRYRWPEPQTTLHSEENLMSSLVNQITQLEFQLTDVEARQLTDQIKDTADQLWKLLLRAYEGKAWTALGYQTWEAYTNAEFDMRRDYAYKVLRQG